MKPGTRRHFQRFQGGYSALSLVAVLFLAEGAAARRPPTAQNRTHPTPRLTSDLTGSVPVHDGDHIRISTHLGDVIIRTQNSNKVDYHAHLETDTSQKDAQQLLGSYTIAAHPSPDGVYVRADGPQRHGAGRLWVTLELNIPKNASVDVSTGGGNIIASDVAGRVVLSTAGGNITAGAIGGPGRLDTGGGNIVAMNVAGELNATTGGGYINIGSVAGNASLRTGGGEIRVASVQGTAHLDTGGGNITLEHSGAELTAETGGGEIEVGEAAGLVRARTSGGGIRVVRMFGPTDLVTSGGSIYLAQVDSAVKASTSDGGITAWFVTPVKGSGACELQSDSGDIVVHLPRELPVTIDAQVQRGSDHRVIVDPAFPLKVSYDDSLKGGHIVRAEGDLNGGGEVLKLRTVAGNIRFVLSDSSAQVEVYKQQMLQLHQQMDRFEQSRQQKLQQQSQAPDENSRDSH